MKRILLALGIFGGFACIACAQTADEVIAKHVAARGLDKLFGVEAVRIARHRISGGMVIRQVLEFKRPSSIRNSSWMGAFLWGFESSDGTSGWKFEDYSIAPMSAEWARQYPPVSDILEGPFVNYKAKGYSVELAGKRQVRGRDCYELKTTTNKGAVESRCLDAATFLEVERTAYSAGAVQFRIEIGDHRPVNGIMFPHLLRQFDQYGNPLEFSVVDDIELDAPLNDSWFGEPNLAAKTLTFGGYLYASTALARAIIFDSLRGVSSISGVKILDDGFEFHQSWQDAAGRPHSKTFSFPYAKLVQVQHLTTFAQKNLYGGLLTGSKREAENDHLRVYLSDKRLLVWSSEAIAERFLTALNLILTSKENNTYAGDALDLEQFRADLHAWRQAGGAAAWPDSAYRQSRILGEAAYRQGKLEEAAQQFQAGVVVAPYWAEGWFNAAMIHGELKDYAEAVLEMRRYLEISPGAQDSQAARDQIVLWQHELSK